jgi:hypothetical protein
MQSSIGTTLNMEASKMAGGDRFHKPNVNVTDRLNSAGNLISWKNEASLEPAYKSARAQN